MQKRETILISIVIFLCCPMLMGQNDNIFSREGKQLQFEVFKTQNTSISINDIVTKDIGFESANLLKDKSHPKDIYWVKIDLEKELENLSTDSLWYLRLNYYQYASIYYDRGEGIEELKFGSFGNMLPQNSVLFNPGVPFSASTLFQNRYIYLKLQKTIKHTTVSKWKFAYFGQDQMKLIQNFYSNQDLKRMIPIYVFVGICAVMFFFTLMFFIYARRLEFLFYSLYTLFLVLYLAPNVLELHHLLFGGFNLYSYTFFQVSQISANLFYILFVMFYLNTKANYPKLNTVLWIVAGFLAFIFVFDIIALLTEQFIWHIRLLNIERLIMSAFGLGGMLYLILKGKSKLSYFVVVGSFFYLAGALGFLFLGERILMITGSAIEIFLFAIGLTYKIQQENKDKLHFQKESIRQKNKALRAQINPHFIFNSLSSIQHLITSDNKVSSLKYLSKFSRLTRNILESSIETNVVLVEEIKMLKDYLELESLRFDNAFNYNITIDDNLDSSAIEVPFMILQPFLENAIIHGLLSKKEGAKELKIKFYQEQEFVVCEVDDNGVGRIAASQKEHIHKQEKKSRGINVTKQRLEMLGTNSDSIKIIDKTDNHGNSTGTKVIIRIPI